MDFLVDKRSIYVSQMIRAANIDEEQLDRSFDREGVGCAGSNGCTKSREGKLIWQS